MMRGMLRRNRYDLLCRCLISGKLGTDAVILDFSRQISPLVRAVYSSLYFDPIQLSLRLD